MDIEYDAGPFYLDGDRLALVVLEEQVWEITEKLDAAPDGSSTGSVQFTCTLTELVKDFIESNLVGGDGQPATIARSEKEKIDRAIAGLQRAAAEIQEYLDTIKVLDDLDPVFEGIYNG